MLDKDEFERGQRLPDGPELRDQTGPFIPCLCGKHHTKMVNDDNGRLRREDRDDFEGVTKQSEGLPAAMLQALNVDLVFAYLSGHYAARRGT
ncbi:MAG TPA: hypothetical protein VGO31_10405 [Microbacteriaceae bacterium]|nr:hypothetical protein [Microbacteriaceae bacterium]